MTTSYGAPLASLTNYLGSTGQKTDNASIGKLWQGAFGSFGTSYTGSAAQNAALLHALQTGYKSNVNNGNISGSSSVQQGQNTTSAMNAASSAINQNSNTTNGTTTPPPPPVTANSPLSTNATIASYQTLTQTAITQAQNDSAVALKPVTDAYTSNLATLQLQRTNAIAQAKATYAQANPNGFGSDEDEYVASITSAYDTQIQNASNSYADAVAQNSQGLQDNLNNINATYQQNVQTYQQNQQQNLEWTLANDPPQPLDLSGIDTSNQQSVQSALLTWGSQNADLINTAFSTGQYGDENNMNDYLSAVAELSSPTKASIEEQTEQEKVGIEQGELGVSQGNEQINAGKLGLSTEEAQSTTTDTTSSPPWLLKVLSLGFDNATTKTSKKNLPTGSNDDPLGLGL